MTSLEINFSMPPTFLCAKCGEQFTNADIAKLEVFEGRKSKTVFIVACKCGARTRFTISQEAVEGGVIKTKILDARTIKA